MKKVKNISLIILVLALLIIGSSSIVVTNENEYSLIRQFGKVDHVVSTAGVTFKIPFVQSVDKLPKEILLYDLSSSDVITSDKKTMILRQLHFMADQRSSEIRPDPELFHLQR